MSAMLTLSTRDSTPPSSRHHCIMGVLSSAEELVYLQKQRGRENETEKKRKEKKGKDLAVGIFLYTGQKTQAALLCWLSLSVRKGSELWIGRRFFKAFEITLCGSYSDTLRVLGLDPDDGGSQTPILW